ncbi:MAG: sigma-70 family RNA polymerase sigma factor [Flavobacteriaceae bacterium]|nr:MAG: sigma-70 family RNA polymerase sigma factor [Flavobacteriaceae bacterium]
MTSANKNSAGNPDKKTLTIVHLLQPYAKQRIRVGEILGIFPRNMYKSNEIIDEVVLETYEKGLHKENEVDELRLTMFQMLNDRFQGLFQNEEWHKDAISTKYILEQELRQLEENFTMDGGNDLIMNEELDDISYHQDSMKSNDLPYDDEEEGVRAFLGLDNVERNHDFHNRSNLRKVYYKLPVNTSNIVDLYILGRLSYHEIGSILKMNVSEVKEIVNFVRETIKKQLD